MGTLNWIITSAPEIFLLLAIAIGTILGRIRFRGFALGATACILIVAVILGQLGNFVIPPLLKSIFFSLFVFTIGYRSGFSTMVRQIARPKPIPDGLVVKNGSKMRSRSSRPIPLPESWTDRRTAAPSRLVASFNNLD